MRPQDQIPQAKAPNIKSSRCFRTPSSLRDAAKAQDIAFLVQWRLVTGTFLPLSFLTALGLGLRSGRSYQPPQYQFFDYATKSEIKTESKPDGKHLTCLFFLIFFVRGAFLWTSPWDRGNKPVLLGGCARVCLLSASLCMLG